MAVAQMMQYCVAALSLAKLPGNRFVNGIIFGVGEIFSMWISNFLMGRLLDMTAFRLIYCCGVASYLILMCFPDSVWLPYLGNILLVSSVGGWFNVQFLILELRVPPQNVGSVSAITRTIAVGAAMGAPTIATLPTPYPFIIVMIVATAALLLSFFLPPPGTYLPSVQKTGDIAVVLVDKNTNTPTLANPLETHPLTNLGLHQASFTETFTERVLNVSRPHLNESALDPDIYLHEASYTQVSNIRDQSQLLRAWAEHTYLKDDDDNSPTTLPFPSRLN